MLEYLKKKSIGSYINLFAAVFALVMTIVYGVYSKTYGLFSAGPVVCLVFAIAINAVLFMFETNFDEYLKIVAAFLTALAMALFIVAFAGDILDYINQVEFLGRGAKVAHIITIMVFMFILVATQVATCFFRRKNKEEEVVTE